MQGSESPLQVIHQKEVDLRQQVDMARRQAEARIQAARAEAAEGVREADQAGRAEASAYYRDGIAQAQQEAQAIISAAAEEAAALRHQAMARMDQVARQIAELVYAAFDG